MELLVKSGLAIAAPVLILGALAAATILFETIVYLLHKRTARGLVRYIKTIL